MIWGNLPQWVQYLSQGLMLFGLMACSAVVLSRTGKNSYWALFTVVPYFLVIALWVFAWTRWPEEIEGADHGADQGRA